MKSILNDVNRLEKAWDLFIRLVDALNKYSIANKNNPHPQTNLFKEMVKANAFIEKYGEKPNPVCKCGRMV
jgi:hypothetical protein